MRRMPSTGRGKASKKERNDEALDRCAALGAGQSAVFGFVIPFFVSSCGGTIIAAVLVTAMKKMKIFDIYLGNLEHGGTH